MVRKSLPFSYRCAVRRKGCGWGLRKVPQRSRETDANRGSDLHPTGSSRLALEARVQVREGEIREVRQAAPMATRSSPEG